MDPNVRFTSADVHPLPHLDLTILQHLAGYATVLEFLFFNYLVQLL